MGRWAALAFVALLCGCLDARVVEKYVCSDGWVADSADGCGGHDRVCPACVCQKTECPDCVCANGTDEAPAKSAGGCEALGCPPGTSYVSSRTSGKFHACDCRFAKALSAKNRVCYASAQDAVADGKEPCGICAASG
jgi:hypothetical protein